MAEDTPTPTPEFDEFRRKIEDLPATVLTGFAEHTPDYHHNNDDIATNEQGGKQSRVDHSFVDLEPEMLLRVTAVLHTDRVKYGSRNWRNIPYEDHVNHMGYHWTMLLQGDTSEDHLANIICRAMFAIGVSGANQKRVGGS